jgi:DNA repair exonuclease SbcCD ATPase subunit
MNDLGEIERDGSREYIPLPGGWEIQTKGNGSSYRLLDKKSDERHNILSADALFIHDFVTRMAKEVHEAYAEAAAELTRLREENKASVGLRQRLALAEEIAASLHKQCEAKDAEIERLKARLFPPDCPPADQERDHLAEQCATLGKENASFSTENERLRAKLERAKEALEPFGKLRVGRFETDGLRYDYRLDAAWVRRAHAVHAELSADAPAQPQISNDVRSLLDEAIAALGPMAEAATNLDDAFRDTSDIWEHSSAMSLTGGDLRRAATTLSKLRAARNG